MKTKNKTYDVIIIGAGPAGFSAATVLAPKKRVLVLEKKRIVGSKICAGGLTVKDFEELHIPKFLIEEEFSCANLYFRGKKYKLELDQPWIWTCSREELGKWQLEEAKSKGAEVKLNLEAVEIQKNYVVTKDGEKLFFKYLIGADGSSSIVRKFLGLKVKKIILAVHYHVSREKFDALEVFFELKKFGPSYAWIFPHKDYSSIGAGADLRFINAAKFRRHFDTWCKEIGFNPREYKLQAAPINYDFQGLEFGNIFLTGDAAGLASGLTGEGIHSGFVSGREAARKILNPKHDFEELSELLENKRLEEKVLEVYQTSKIAAKAMFCLGFLFLKNKSAREKLAEFLTEK